MAQMLWLVDGPIYGLGRGRVINGGGVKLRVEYNRMFDNKNN